MSEDQANGATEMPIGPDTETTELWTEPVETVISTLIPDSPPPVRQPKAKGPATPKGSNASAATARARKAIDASKHDDFGLRLGTQKAQAAAMYARAVGATLNEVKAVVGSVQFNVIRELESKGHSFRRVVEEGDGGRKATRYFLTHTQ